MEIRDLYNENKELTGETIVKGEDVPKGRYYITVVVWIQNDNGEFLIQKRVQRKDGKWATTGGHPVSGETSKQGIITEIKEELGIDTDINKIQLFMSNINNNSIDSILAFKNSIFSNLSYSIIIWILGLTIIGVIFNVFLLFLTSSNN